MLNKWLTHSLSRTLLTAFLLVSVLPLIVISVLFIRQNTDALTAQMERNLAQLAEAKAQEIELRLQDVAHSTKIAAHYAEELLQAPFDETTVVRTMAKYQPDSRDILGLDVYYAENDGATRFGDDLSNVFWPETAAPSHVATQIVQTEALDTAFAGIKNVNPDTQWVYLTTPDGMMRLYPWATNDHYPADWNPQEIIFYTVAEPANNPSAELQWTPPYVDFAGAGWMVTASQPLYATDGTFLGVMSHDVTIESLQENVLSITVLDDAGYGFLVDSDGGVIAHPAFVGGDELKGTETTANLLTWQADAQFNTIVRQMIAGATGAGYYSDEAGEALLVYAPVESTGWSLGITVPREQVIAPAIQMRNRLMLITVGLIGVASAVAVLLTRLIHKPLEELLQGVYQISDSGRADAIDLETFGEIEQLAFAFNEMADKVYERERNLREQVALMEIQIDTERQKKRVSAIVETDFFKRLERSAEQLRQDIKQAPLAVPHSV